jgi:hypothetical protein
MSNAMRRPAAITVAFGAVEVSVDALLFFTGSLIDLL